MACPKCGNTQPSEDNVCSRCGYNRANKPEAGSEEDSRAALGYACGEPALPADWGELPELPEGGPRPLTAKDLEGYTEEEWAAIAASEKERTHKSRMSGQHQPLKARTKEPEMEPGDIVTLDGKTRSEARTKTVTIHSASEAGDGSLDPLDGRKTRCPHGNQPTGNWCGLPPNVEWESKLPCCGVAFTAKTPALAREMFERFSPIGALSGGRQAHE